MPCRPGHLKTCLCGVLLVAAQILRAGDARLEGALTNVPAKGFRLKLFTANDGLPQSQVTCIKQTRDGYLWLGTWIGLARFDGRNLDSLNKLTTPELVSAEINGLSEDPQGALWIATRGGLLSYLDHRFNRISTNQGLPRDELWRLKAGQNGVWVEGANFLARVLNGRVQSTALPWTDPILSMFETSEGGLHLLNRHQWLTWFPDQNVIRTNFTADPRIPGWICALFDADGKAAWIGTGRSLYRLSNNKLTPERIIDGETDDVRLLYRDRDAKLWAYLKHRGLFRRLNNVWELIVPQNRLAAGVNCFEQDAEGNFWAGTDQGLLQIQPMPVKSFTVADGLANNETRSVCESEDGTIWVATLRGTSRIRDDRIVPIEAEEPNFDFEGKAVWPRNGGGVWIGKVGPSIQDFSNERFHDWKGTIPASAVSAMCEDKAGRLWMAAAEGLVSVAPGGEIICRSNIFPGGIRPAVYGLASDSQGTIWIGTKQNGLAHLVDDHCSVYSQKEGLGPGAIFSIHEDSDKAIWLGTENGLVRFKDGIFFSFNREHGLFEAHINCILEDDFGYLWLSGLHGIYAIERSKLNDVAEGRAAIFPCFVVGEADGMVIVETNGGENQPAGWKARDGRLWFPTLAGVVVIDPRTIPVREPPPKVHIEQIKANDQPLAMVADPGSRVPMKIKAGTRLIEFNYTAATFVEPERARFRHRLVGFDGRWCESTTDRSVRYYNLRPGNYRFEVLGANRHNIWTTEPTSFEFSLAPFFWQTWTFYCLCAAILLGVAGLFHRYRLQWQHRVLKLEEQRALSNERSRIARDLHDDIGGSLTGIALQLEAARRRGSANKDDLAVLAEESRALSRVLRELAWTTNPRCDNAGSLAAFIGESAERFCRAAGVECRLHLPASDGSEEVPARVRYELLAVLKESLANAARHAQARTVTIDLAANNGDLRLMIKDDGKGFDPSIPAAGSGLKNLRERVQQAGGWLNLESKPGGGTAVIACLPRKTPDTHDNGPTTND